VALHAGQAEEHDRLVRRGLAEALINVGLRERDRARIMLCSWTAHADEPATVV